jgi:hypothetical protein
VISLFGRCDQSAKRKVRAADRLKRQSGGAIPKRARFMGSPPVSPPPRGCGHKSWRERKTINRGEKEKGDPPPPSPPLVAPPPLPPPDNYSKPRPPQTATEKHGHAESGGCGDGGGDSTGSLSPATAGPS